MLAILTVMAVGIGHRVALSLRTCRYQRDGLKALYLARAGINVAIGEIGRDTSFGYDTSSDGWARNDQLFQRIILSDNPNESACVSYTRAQQGGTVETVYGLEAEEDRININTASEQLLVDLLTLGGVSDPEAMAKNILIWRGDAADTANSYASLGYLPKGSDFANIDELGAVKDVTVADIAKIKGVITVYGDSVNINTATAAALRAVFYAKAKEKNVDTSSADSLLQKVLSFLSTAGNHFEDTASIATSLAESQGLEEGSGEDVIIKAAVSDASIGIKSIFIRIASQGRVNNVTKNISCVYDRSSKKTVFWHQD
jgi:type II secretory pathway component PulK